VPCNLLSSVDPIVGVVKPCVWIDYVEGNVVWYRIGMTCRITFLSFRSDGSEDCGGVREGCSSKLLLPQVD